MLLLEERKNCNVLPLFPKYNNFNFEDARLLNSLGPNNMKCVPFGFQFVLFNTCCRRPCLCLFSFGVYGAAKCALHEHFRTHKG